MKITAVLLLLSLAAALAAQSSGRNTGNFVIVDRNQTAAGAVEQSGSGPQPIWVADPSAGHFDCPDGYAAYERTEPHKFEANTSMPAIYYAPKLDAKGHVLIENGRKAICIPDKP